MAQLQFARLVQQLRQQPRHETHQQRLAILNIVHQLQIQTQDLELEQLDKFLQLQQEFLVGQHLPVLVE